MYLDHFRICQEENGVFKESACADNMKLNTTAKNSTSRYQTRVTGVVKTCVTSEWHIFVTFLARGGYLYLNTLYLNIYIYIKNDFLIKTSFLPQQRQLRTFV